MKVYCKKDKKDLFGKLLFKKGKCYIVNEVHPYRLSEDYIVE